MHEFYADPGVSRHRLHQWEVIQGRLVGKPFVPPLPRSRSREERPERHKQPATLRCSQPAISMAPQKVISPSPWLKDLRAGLRG
jgi:hypothetical protein